MVIVTNPFFTTYSQLILIKLITFQWFNKASMYHVLHCILYLVGVKVQNMKMDVNIYGTWHLVGQWTLMMNFFYFFIQLSCLVTPYNIVQKIFLLRDDFYTILYGMTKWLSRIKKILKFSSLVFIAHPDAKCHKC